VTTGNIGPSDPRVIPRFAGPPTFARLPRLDQVEACDIAVVGVPFDAGTTYRPGARFGPASVRSASRLLRDYHPALDVEPFGAQQVCDAGDIACNPFSIAQSVSQVEEASRELLGQASAIIAIGGDHTIALPLLRTVVERRGPVALLHFDAHLDTWDTYFGAEVTHGTPFRRAWEENLLLAEHAMHVGIRGPLFTPKDLLDDKSFGFKIVTAMDLEELGVAGVVERVRARIGDAPLYVSVDIDVLDPAAAPGTGTPEPGGLTSRELLGIVRGLAGLNLVGADVVEVAPAYDHAEITATAACHVAYDLLSVFATNPSS
jgi:agmatinase